MDIKQNREKWVELLESGEYTQGKSVLAKVEKSNINYCCLGVGCEVAIGAGTHLAKVINNSGVISYNMDRTAFPKEVSEIFGFDSGSNSPYVMLDGWSVGLIGLNDEKGYTFQEIANVIKAQPETWDGTEGKANQGLKSEDVRVLSVYRVKMYKSTYASKTFEVKALDEKHAREVAKILSDGLVFTDYIESVEKIS